MRVLIVSDIHGNLDALEAVLGDAGGFDQIWSLGDVVGYGPQPNECISRLCDLPHVAVPGNHDWGVLGRLGLDEFNPEARQANAWTRWQLCPESMSYLDELEPTRVECECTLAHGSPRDAVREYLFRPDVAQESFSFFSTSTCFVGHTHVPVVFRLERDDEVCEAIALPERQPVRLDTARYIVNPGSVGQPRDSDPRAAYLLLDVEERMVEQRRVAYDIDAVQHAMRAARLPRRLSMRLAFGW